MPQTHHLPAEVQTQHEAPSTVFWSVGVPKKLIFFVHGFGGGQATWPLFPALLPRTAPASEFDFLFYQYDGQWTQANSSALELLTFIDEFLRDPLSVVRATVGETARPDTFQYERVVFVAHSLGSVVVRRALLNAGVKAASDPAIAMWLATTRMILFAPAHVGTYAAPLASELLTTLPWFLGRLAGIVGKFQSPLIAELQRGSVVLDALLNDTNAALVKDPDAEWLVAHGVVWAKKERVVINSTFAADPVPVQLNDRNHSSVCKPRDVNDQGLVIVVGAL